MKLFQGKTYEPEVTDESEETPKVVSAEDKPEKLPHKRIIFGIVGVLVAVLIAISIFSIVGKKAAKKPDPEDITVGDSDYWSQYDEPSTYTEDEKTLLRSWGYTGDEIESNEKSKTHVDDLVAEAKKEQEAARATLSNPQSPEYQKLLNETWLGQDAINLPAYKKDVTESELSYVTHTYNADYTKVPPHGHNLFLKVYLPDGSYAFMECAITRFMQLKDVGNIVVSYTEITFGKTSIIEDMKEVAVDADDD